MAAQENEPDHIRAHATCYRNREAIEASDKCGCFHCLAMFTPDKIREWIDGPALDGDSGVTALCPKCGIDSVIADHSGFPVATEFLERMHEHWFEETSTDRATGGILRRLWASLVEVVGGARPTGDNK